MGSKHSRYAKEIAKGLAKADIRVEAKTDAQTVGKKIREGEMQKVPYLLIVGDKELKAKSVSVRERGKGDIGKMKLGKFIAEIKK